MKFAFKRSTSPVAYCALHIKAGTRYEAKGLGGLAHFTEHLLFKGTQTKSAGTVNSFIEKLGGELNAYTTKEETVIHATVLKEDLRKAVNLLMDIAFRCTFPEREIEKERGVVLEEINTYKDSPSEQIYDDFEEYLFEGTPLSMPVLGKAKFLRKIGRDTVTGYYRKMFNPDNMYFTIVADISEKRAKEMVAHALDSYSTFPGAKITDSDISCTQQDARTPVEEGCTFRHTVTRHSHQAHCIIGAKAYSAYDPRRIPLSLLINIIGGPVANSRLNLLLREKYGLVYSIEASYGVYSDTGLATVYFGCEKGNVNKCMSLIEHMMEGIRKEPLSQRALSSAKKQLLGQLAISSDNGEAQVLSMGKSLMTYGRVIDNSETAKLIEAITAEEILETANEIFRPSSLSILQYI